jgi:hypothetical protein
MVFCSISFDFLDNLISISIPGLLDLVDVSLVGFTSLLFKKSLSLAPDDVLPSMAA